jgi:hypothetical protein
MTGICLAVFGQTISSQSNLRQRKSKKRTDFTKGFIINMRKYFPSKGEIMQQTNKPTEGLVAMAP